MRVFFLIIFSFLIQFNFSQKTSDIGVLLGGGYYVGDINPYQHFYNTKFAGSIFFRDQINKNDRLTYRISASRINLEAFDADFNNDRQINRNLNFKSSITEIAGILEIHFLPYEIGSKRKFGTPYLFFGLSYFKMNPMGKYNDDWIELQSLATEGQGTSANDKNPYKLNQISIPFGVGVKLNINSRIAIGLEYGLRKTFTDYIDDISGDYVNANFLRETNGFLSGELSDQSLNNESTFSSNHGVSRGNPNNKDWFAMAGFTISYRLKAYTTCR